MPWTDTRRFALALVALALLATAAAAVGIGGRASYGAQVTADEPQYLLSALSLFSDADLDISDELEAQRWRAFHESQLPEQTRALPDERRVSPHDPLLPVLLALPMGLGGWVGAKLALAALAGVTAAATAWVAVRRLRVLPGVALPVVAVFWLSAPLAVYGHQVYPEMPAALAVVVAVGALAGPLRRAGVWVAVAAIVALPWLSVKYAPVGAALTALLVLRLVGRGRRTTAAAAIAVLTAAGATYVWAHVLIYDGMTAYAAGDHFVGDEFTAVGSGPNYLGRSVRLVGLLIDREFGLAAWQPAWLLAFPAVAAIVRRREDHWALIAAPLAAGWLTATFLALTMHGYWFAGRQVVVVLPLAVLAVCVAASRWRLLRHAVLAVGVLGVWSYGWLVAGVLRGDVTWIVDFFDVADPWYRAWSTLLPAYRFLSTGMWARHTLWLIILGAAAVAVWRRERPSLELTVGGPGP